MAFLKNNAMGISALCGAVLTVIFVFAQLSSTQTAVLVGVPPVIGNFLANLVLRSPKETK